MTYLKRTNISQQRRTFLTSVIVFAIALIWIVHMFFPSFYGGLLAPLGTALWSTETGFVGFFVRTAKLLVSKNSLIVENEKLKQDIQSRDQFVLLTESLREENEVLKKSLGRDNKSNDILGVVVSRPPVSVYDTLIIDIGSHDDVRVGNNVYTEGETLIGTIAEVYPYQSKVMLFSAPGNTISVIIGESRTIGEARGRGLGNFMIQLPADIHIKEGDTVQISQVRPHVFGVVEKIVVDSSDSLQTILFKSPVNINTLRFVEVDRKLK